MPAELRLDIILAADLAKLRPDEYKSSYNCAATATKIAALGRRARALATTACNGLPYWDKQAQRRLYRLTEKDQERIDKAKERIRLRVIELLADWPLEPGSVHVAGDPRGLVLSWQFTGWHDRKFI